MKAGIEELCKSTMVSLGLFKQLDSVDSDQIIYTLNFKYPSQTHKIYTPIHIFTILKCT